MHKIELGKRVARWAIATAALVVASLPAVAQAAPEAHLLRIDPRAGINAGSPTLTTLMELGQFKSISDVTGGCGALTGGALADCYADAVEKPNALWTPLQFPEQSANLFVRVEGADTPATFVSKALFKDAQKEVGVGTAWLLALDCASSMGPRYGDAREVVLKFVEQMGKNDLVRVYLFDDRDNAYTADSKWKTFAERNSIVQLLNANPGVARSGGSSRPLFNTVKNMMTNGFNDLGNVGTTASVPMHQAFVLMSNGAGREDALSNGAGALQIQQYATDGRMKQGDSSSLKMPLPIISIHLPNSTTGLTNKFMANNDTQFMQSLANPQIGGLYSIIREGQGGTRGARIVAAVKARFNAMWVVKWKLSCLNPSVEQSFNLTFTNTKQAIQPDGSFKNVPIGVDPSQWPLDINVAASVAEATANPLHPGGTFKVYGTFCWGGDNKRAEAYFIPTGMQFDPNQKAGGIAAAQRMMQNLIAQNMRGSATEVNATFATFEVPDDDKLLEGTGDNTVARLVVFDNRANRASGMEATTVLTLKAGKKPFNLILIGGIAAAVIIVGLLVAVLLRSGGNKRGGGGGGGGGHPQPIYAGAPPGGGGYPPPGGGYPPQGGGYPPPQGGGYPPPGGYGGGGGYGAAPADVHGVAIASFDANPIQAAPAPVILVAPAAPPEMGGAQLAPNFPAHGRHGRAGAAAAGQSVWGQTS